MRKIVMALSVLAGLALVSYGDAKQATETISKAIQKSALSPQLKVFSEKILLPFSGNAVVVSEVEKQNSKKIPLEKIKQIDKEWSSSEEPLPIQDEKMSNPCAKELQKLVKDNSAIVEVFVMDDQGANVGQNNLTSDYWQGDEAKWQNSFNKGQGGLDVGEAKFDRSANAVIQQISIPIHNAEGKVVGAITYGIAIDKVK